MLRPKHYTICCVSELGTAEKVVVAVYMDGLGTKKVRKSGAKVYSKMSRIAVNGEENLRSINYYFCSLEQE